MAERYEHLIQALAPSRLTKVYTARTNTATIVKEIILCNLDDETRKFDLAIVKADEYGNIETMSDKAYIFNKTNIDPHETISLSVMLCLDSSSEVMIGADEAGKISFNAFGVTADL